METLYPYVFKGTEFNFRPWFCNFLAKMRILIDILLKDDVCEKLSLDKSKFYSQVLCKIKIVNKSKF